MALASLPALTASMAPGVFGFRLVSKSPLATRAALVFQLALSMPPTRTAASTRSNELDDRISTIEALVNRT